MIKQFLILAILLGLAHAPSQAPIGAAQSTAPAAAKGMTKSVFGTTPDGKQVDLYVMKNAKGVEASVTNYGAIVVSIKTPDRAGKVADVVLGYDTLEGYLEDRGYLGAIAGRYANRIAKGSFTLDGERHTLPKNNGENTLHGGIKGFNRVVWDARDVSTPAAPAVELTYVSPDGEEGFPGTLTTRVVYTLTDRNELRIDLTATTDKPTVVNLTNHSYFNFTGSTANTILDHVMTIFADRFTPVDAETIPTGRLAPVAGTPFDFRKPTRIGARIESDHEQIKLGRGYDHNYVLGMRPSAKPRLAARVSEPTTGRVMEVWTTEPGVQFYTGNYLTEDVKGKGGVGFKPRSGFCLETQHFPDSPNKPNFPTTVLRPGKTYRSTTVFAFAAR